MLTTTLTWYIPSSLAYQPSLPLFFLCSSYSAWLSCEDPDLSSGPLHMLFPPPGTLSWCFPGLALPPQISVQNHLFGESFCLSPPHLIKHLMCNLMAFSPRWVVRSTRKWMVFIWLPANPHCLLHVDFSTQQIFIKQWICQSLGVKYWTWWTRFLPPWEGVNTYNKSEFQDTSVLSGTGPDGARERENMQSVVREGSLEQQVEPDTRGTGRQK